MQKSSKNPASGGTLGGAEQFDVAGSKSVCNLSAKRLQRPAAPRFTLRRQHPALWRVTFADGQVILLNTDLVHSLAKFRREVKARLGFDYPKMSRGRWFETLHSAIERGGP